MEITVTINSTAVNIIIMKRIVIVVQQMQIDLELQEYQASENKSY